MLRSAALFKQNFTLMVALLRCRIEAASSSGAAGKRGADRKAFAWARFIQGPQEAFRAFVVQRNCMPGYKCSPKKRASALWKTSTRPVRACEISWLIRLGPRE